jgi:hypothetical protein
VKLSDGIAEEGPRASAALPVVIATPRALRCGRILDPRWGAETNYNTSSPGHPPADSVVGGSAVHGVEVSKERT